ALARPNASSSRSYSAPMPSSRRVPAVRCSSACEMSSRASAAPAYVYVPDLGAAGSEVELSAAESHYVARVCRARSGEAVEATDGRGAVATLRLAAVERRVRAAVE